MNKKEKLKEIITKKNKMLNSAIIAIDELNKSKPKLQEICRISDWELKAINELSEDTIEKYNDETIDFANKSYEYINEKIPQIPGIDYQVISASNAATVSGSGQIYISITEENGANQPPFSTLIYEYQNIQKDQSREQDVSYKLHKFDGNTAVLFEKSMSDIKNCMATSQGYEKAALSMRNTLDKFKGELFEKALPSSNIPKNQKWETMAREITRTSKTELSRLTIMNEEVVYDKMYSELSVILKERKLISSAFKFSNMSTEYIDHIFSILNSIDETYFQSI